MPISTSLSIASRPIPCPCNRDYALSTSGRRTSRLMAESPTVLAKKCQALHLTAMDGQAVPRSSAPRLGTWRRQCHAPRLLSVGSQ